MRLLVASNTGSTGLPGDWLIVFDLTPEQSAEVLIDRQEGGVAMVRVVPHTIACTEGRLPGR